MHHIDVISRAPWRSNHRQLDCLRNQTDFSGYLQKDTKRRVDSLHKRPGGRLNKKDGLTRYGDSHVKDKTS